MKKIFSLLTAFVFSFVMFAPGFVLAADNAALSTSQKLEKVEQMLYGNTQGGSLIQRMDTIENDVYGIATDDPVLGRVTRMYDYLVGIPSNGEASFATKLNMVECGKVILRKHVLVGAGTIILPGVEIGIGTSVGSIR